MKKKKIKSTRQSPELTFKDFPFTYLIKESEDLKKLRREYQSLSAKERWQAADYQYHSSIAASQFNNAIGRSAGKKLLLPEELYALVIAPNFAPAILTLGSYEYLYGRIDEAINCFLSLINLPEDTDDIESIIDKAGDFLLDNGDIENALKLYSSACCEHPNNAVYRNGKSYCLQKLGRLEEALNESRKTVALEPDNYVYLSDFGWALIEAEKYDEAKEILEQAVILAPADYELAKGNLEELHRRMKSD